MSQGIRKHTKSDMHLAKTPISLHSQLATQSDQSSEHSVGCQGPKHLHVDSKDPFQTAQMHRLSWVFAVCMTKPLVLGYPLSAKWRLIRLHRCTGWAESLLEAHAILEVLMCLSSKLSHSITKLNKKTCSPGEHSDQPGHPPIWSESLLCAQWVAKDMWAAKTLIRLGWSPG